MKPDREKICFKKGEFNNKGKSVVFEDCQADPLPLQKQKRIQDTLYQNHLKSSIDFEHPQGENQKKYFQKNNEFCKVNGFTTKKDIQYCEEITAKIDHNPITMVNDNQKHFKHKSISTNFSNPITNPISETNIFRLNPGLNDRSNYNNKTFMTSNSNILSVKNKKPNEVGFKQFSMGKITTQSVSSVSEKSKNIDVPKPITSFAHYKDDVSNQTYYLN